MQNLQDLLPCCKALKDPMHAQVEHACAKLSKEKSPHKFPSMKCNSIQLFTKNNKIVTGYMETVPNRTLEVTR